MQWRLENAPAVAAVLRSPRREDMKLSSASHYRRRPMTHAVAVHAASVQPARIA
jgi:hypothetical protein